MATSRFRALRTALATAIRSQLTSDSVTGVRVFDYGRIITPQEDQIYISNIRGEQDPYTFSGGGSGLRQENIEIDVMIEVPRPGTTEAEFAEAEIRAETIMASIESTVRADPEIGSTVFDSEFDSFETDHQFADKVAWGRIEITITAEAHI